MYKANLMKSPKYMYCPSEFRSYHMFEGYDNRWFPDDAPSLFNNNLNHIMRAGYLLRPCDAKYRPIEWRGSTNPPAPPIDDLSAPPNLYLWNPYPSLSKMKR